MNKRNLFILVLIATLVNCNGSKPLNVKIKVGVVMKSGDVKNVARQDLIISKADIIDLWETSKKNNRWAPDLIRKDTQDELGYDAKLNSFRESINEKSIPVNQLHANLQREREVLAQRLYEHIEKSFQEAPGSLGVSFSYLTNHSVGLDEAGLKAVDNKYKQLIDDNANPWAEVKQFLETRYAEFKEIKGSYDRYVNALAAVNTGKEQHELDNLVKEQQEFIELANKKVAERDKSYFEKAKADFLLNFKEVFASLNKTDLNGEANIRIPTGKYFIFCSSEIGLNHITWDYVTNVAKEGQYIELANDNAFSFKEEDTTQLLKVLYEALTKMGSIQPTPK
jgi:hypothetical protein